MAKKNETVFVAASVGELEAIVASENYFSSGDAWNRTSSNLHPNTSFLLYQRDELAGLLPPGSLPGVWYREGLFTEARRYKPNMYRIDMHLPNGAVVMQEEEVPINESVDTMIVAANPAMTAGPFEVINHQTRAKESVVQLSDMSLVLNGTDGKPLWKRTLDSKIVGSLYQVDALKNGKLQMVFCTEKALYVVDRKGNDLDGFPLALPDAVSGSVAVFDYDQNRTYRLLVPCANGKVYNYNLQAKNTEGWKLPEFPDPVLRMLHARTGSEDHLIAIDTQGKVHVLKRNGQRVYTCKEMLKTDELAADLEVIAGASIDKSSIHVVGADRKIALQR
jgi:hypothetical protein